MDIRRHVFIEEQQVPENEEIDDHDRIDDPLADHFLFLEEDHPVGTVRCLKKPGGILKIGRVAIIQEERGKGLGRQMMDLVEAYYPDFRRFVLDAQTHAIPFYLKCGYLPMGDIFMDAGIPHMHMEKNNPTFVNRSI
ncbi:MAG: GNAT family N-acetyltransferase [Erysipelotrichaceae bacterium]